MENKPSPAPMHRVVGQLRELLIKSDIHILTPSRHGFEAWDTANECCVLEGSAKSIAVAIAAVNALPALLAIAEAAHARMETYDKGEDYTGGIRSQEWDDLRTALSLLPNPSDQLAGLEIPHEH